ncbi:GNAT family N-acetyltransferase [Sporosarcina sp. E16_3]|uniref:GNAT family N-acetyltransferase n=1 Tax=Sporosarcina sp. E16_3 TaxID=2789293 RepID=UPI001A92E355|nr:GNAT family N-acetyltransferase [Sporosarcina sp. E16_3]MBO0602549.1 GNAT family N-acetyltransferase [Sporosarcina sp. E16_3]
MSNKEKYRKLCETEESIPIFSKDWWLDAVAGKDNWDVITVEKDNRIIASLPFVKSKKSIFYLLRMPPLTQTLGPWLKYPKGQKYANRLSFEKEMYSKLIEGIPYSDVFNQNFHPSISNWLPFYWKGYSQTTRYTYVIGDLNEVDNIYGSFQSKIRTDIKKAEKSLRIIESEDIDQFYEINSLTFSRQNIKTPYSLNFVKKIEEACKINKCRKIYFAVDEKERIHSVLYLVWDQEFAYYLLGGSDPELRNSGSMSLLLWHAIQFSSTVTKAFNFEGSMIEPIERFVRGFGAKQVPYFNISKTNSKLLMAREAFLKMKK